MCRYLPADVIRPNKKKTKNTNGHHNIPGTKGRARSPKTPSGNNGDSESATIERIVKGQYEWRDGGMRDTKGTRKRYWAATREEENDGEEIDSQRTRMASG